MTQPGGRIDGLLGRMGALLEPMVAAEDPRRYFLAVYMRTTAAVKAELEDERLGGFADPAWTEAWDLAFAALYLDAIDRWNEDRTVPLMPLAEQHGTIRFLRAIVTANVADPSLMRFLTATLNIAASPEHPLAPMLHIRWRRFHGFVQQSLMQDIAAGREPHTMEPSRGAEQLLATYEGLQLQSMVRPEMDLLESFDRAVTRLREGWSREYVPPVWDLGRAS